MIASVLPKSLTDLRRVIYFLILCPSFVIAQDFVISEGVREGQPACILILRPRSSTDGASAISLRFVSQSGEDLSIRSVRGGRTVALTLVVGDLRIPFRNSTFRSQVALEASELWTLLTSSPRFHMTAEMRDGTYTSSRFDSLPGSDILNAMERSCEFALPSGVEQEYADEVTNPFDLRLAHWALRRLAGSNDRVFSLPGSLSPIARAQLRRFQTSRSLDGEGSLTQASFQALLNAVGVSIAPSFDEARAFSASGAAVRIGTDWFHIDQSGQRVSALDFDAAQTPQPSGTAYLMARRWIAIDGDGARRRGFLEDRLERCEADWCVFRVGEEFGLISMRDSTRLSSGFDEISPFSDGIAFASRRTARDEKLWTKISEDGNTTPLTWTVHSMSGHQDGFLAVQRDEAGSLAISTLDGQATSDEIYEELSPAGSGLYRAKRSGKVGFIIGRTGKEKVPARFEDAGVFVAGLAPAKLAGRWGYIDKSGRWIVAPQFKSASSFNDTFAVIQGEDGRYGLISFSGDIILEPQFEEIQRFSSGMAAFKLGGKWGFFDAEKLFRSRSLSIE